MTNRAIPGSSPETATGTGAARGARFALVPFAEYPAVRNLPRTGNQHIANGHNVRAECDVAFDLEPVAAAQ